MPTRFPILQNKANQYQTLLQTKNNILQHEYTKMHQIAKQNYQNQIYGTDFAAKMAPDCRRQKGEKMLVQLQRKDQLQCNRGFGTAHSRPDGTTRDETRRDERARAMKP